MSVLRLEPDSTHRVIQAALRDTLGTPVQDIALQDGDSIHVYSLTEFRPKRYITIGGAVQKGGQFPYHDGMTLRDAVLLAGGLSDGALAHGGGGLASAGEPGQRGDGGDAASAAGFHLSVRADAGRPVSGPAGRAGAERRRRRRCR